MPLQTQPPPDCASANFSCLKHRHDDRRTGGDNNAGDPPLQDFMTDRSDRIRRGCTKPTHRLRVFTWYTPDRLSHRSKSGMLSAFRLNSWERHFGRVALTVQFGHSRPHESLSLWVSEFQIRRKTEMASSPFEGTVSTITSQKSSRPESLCAGPFAFAQDDDRSNGLQRAGALLKSSFPELVISKRKLRQAEAFQECPGES